MKLISVLFVHLCVVACAGSTKYLLIGNPGVGKSTILNGLYKSHGCGGDNAFRSGTSFGSGLTYQLDVVTCKGNLYMDTPGLADLEMRKAAAAAITQALQKDGHYKIFFVITEVNGRVRAEDTTTMKLVLEAAPITNYGIVLNQISAKTFDKLKEPKNTNKFVVTLMGGLPRKTAHIHYMLHDPALEAADDARVHLPRDLLEFVNALPGVTIPKREVKDVRGESFDEVNANLEKMQQQMKHDKELFARQERELRRQVDEAAKAQQQELQRWQESQRQQQEAHREERRHWEQERARMYDEYSHRASRYQQYSSRSDDGGGMLAGIAMGAVGAMFLLR
eukprot:TRINITY_DN14794_c0_g1_i1.p1 TRINITY_DN14794_c0_g1~~TRINITY_DN14794_c0_g1_i1.p1  ORF type:complete len:336 (-),score=65.18 TRINITY_DN14794_c0_g1_i1:180-1187(-)